MQLVRPDLIHTTVGAYRIVAQLGAGGMGVVYKALDQRLQRHVALKVLPRDVSGDLERRQRFLQEARAASALNDPHIVTVHDIFEADCTEFLVMELVEGQTLHALASQLTVEQIIDYVGQLASALATAHAAGIVHRDLKPANIIVSDRGLVKVLDFGIAKVHAQPVDTTAMPMTMPGQVIGTAAYMSPEQARGAVVDHRTDIYSLGAILQELLSASAVTAPRLEQVARRALERDAAKRHQSMLDFAADLDVARRRRSWLSVPIIALVSILAGAALIGALWTRPQWTNASTEDTPPVSQMPAAGTESAPTTALAHTRHGLALLRRFDRTGNVDAAVASFESAIVLDAQYAPAWAGLARGFWRRQLVTRDSAWTARARDAVQQAIALDPYLADAHALHGLIQLGAGDLAAAKTLLDHALVLDPSNATAHRALGDLAESAGEFATASSHYSEAMQSDPEDWELPRLLGDIPYAAGNYADALEWYRKAAAAAPDSPTPHRLIGAAHHMLGDYSAAASAFQQSLAIEPTASGYTNLGTALFFQGRYRESVQAFERSREMLPSNPLIWGNLADAYRWVPGNAEKAKEAYARAVQLLREQLAKDPAHVANRSRLALYLAKLGDRDAALTELKLVLSRGVQEVNSWYRAAVTYELCGARLDALLMLQNALERGYSLLEVRMDPELAALRTDLRYHQLIAKFEPVHNTTK
jgi:tetratricopeptide (TPR) repeat protein/predicted Ser/Thr protein kinase